MKCGIVRWLAASARDLPRPVQRHLARCPSCRDYVRVTRALAETARRDAPAYLETVPPPKSGGFVDKARTEAKPGTSFRLVYRRMWIPASVAAGLGLVALLVFRPGTNPPGVRWGQVVAPLENLPAAGEAVWNLAVEMESPLEREFESLRKAVTSAAQVLEAGLDLRMPVSLSGPSPGVFR